jgi:hypothetical protein
MILGPDFNSVDGASTPFCVYGKKKRPVKLVIYGWPKNLILDDDVCAYIHRLQLPISHKLFPISKGKIPYVDVRLEYLDCST